MNHDDREALAARLAKILGREDPEEPGWRHRDLDIPLSIRCRITEDGVQLDLDVTPLVAERVIKLLAGIRWQDT